MTAQPKRSSPEAASIKTNETNGLQEEIRRRAYELYDQRKRQDGHDLDDWLQAESEVATKRKATAVAA